MLFLQLLCQGMVNLPRFLPDLGQVFFDDGVLFQIFPDEHQRKADQQKAAADPDGPAAQQRSAPAADAGPDGKYADFKWNSNGGHDLKKFYRCIPEGESTWRKDGKTGLVTFTASDGTAHTATFFSEPTTLTYEQSGKSFSCQIMNQGLEFPVAGTPMPGWSDYSDFDKYVQNPQRFIVKMKKRQQ